MRFVGRTCLSLAASGVLFGLFAAACIPDPKGEYEDYKARTAGLDQPTTPTVDASIDTKPPEEAVEALYVGICTTKLALKDPAQALRFYTKTKFVPDGAGGGKLTMNIKPLVGYQGGRAIIPTAVAESETRGNSINVPDLTIAAGQGRFTAQLGTMELPGECNSISGSDAIVNNTILDGRFADGEFCALLGGHLIKPYEYDFIPADNACLFIKVNEGDPVPTRAAEQFACPL